MVDAALVSGVLFGVEGFRRAPWMMRRTGQVRQKQTSFVLSSIEDQIPEIRPGFGFRIPKSSLDKWTEIGQEKNIPKVIDFACRRWPMF